MKADIVNQLKSNGCIIIRDEKITLKSGKTSRLYIDMRNCFSDYSLVNKIVELSADKIGRLLLENNCNTPGSDLHVIGVPNAGVPWAKDIATRINKSFLYLRKERKEYGMGNLIEGSFKRGDQAILIEDTTTTGSSTIETIETLSNNGIDVCCVFVMVDRGGARNISNVCPTSSLLDLRDVLPRKDVLFEVSQIKESNLIFSADLETCSEILSILDKVGPYICAVKTHVDLIRDYNPQFNVELMKLANKHFFMIIEDQKYADIGRILKQKYLNNYYRISEWADFVTSHLIAGEGTIKVLSECGAFVIPVIEMSSKDNLITDEYTKNCVEICRKYSETVVGVVCQGRNIKKDDHSDLELAYFSPGINFNTQDDLDNQTYRTPDKLGETDYFIVGSGIYRADNIESAAKRYMEVCKL